MEWNGVNGPTQLNHVWADLAATASPCSKLSSMAPKSKSSRLSIDRPDGVWSPCRPRRRTEWRAWKRLWGRWNMLVLSVTSARPAREAEGIIKSISGWYWSDRWRSSSVVSADSRFVTEHDEWFLVVCTLPLVEELWSISAIPANSFFSSLVFLYFFTSLSARPAVRADAGRFEAIMDHLSRKWI